MDAAIDRLYTVFAAVPRPASIAYCDCCFSPEESRALLAPVPVRDLPVAVLESYASSVLLTVGDVADYRYFLPRILQIAVTEGFSWPDIELVLAGLTRAGWQSWTADEGDAVTGFLAALWLRVLTRDDADDREPDDVDAVLCGIGNAVDDLTVYLREWQSMLGQPVAAAALLHLLHHGRRNTPGPDRLQNSFWDGRDAPAAQVLAWLDGPDLRRAVTVAFDAATDEAVLDVLVQVHDLLVPPR